jgi:putrescine transport system ATP-binding protein
VTCVMVTHDQEEAMTMSTRIGVMNAGQILQIGTPSEMYETPANRFVAGFVGNVNLMDGVLSHDAPDHVIIDCADCKHYVGHGITGTEGMNVTVALRPEKIRISGTKPEGEHNMASGKVKEKAYFGAWTVYRIELPSGMILKVNESNTERHAEDVLTWGDTAWASWSPSAQVVLTS